MTQCSNGNALVTLVDRLLLAVLLKHHDLGHVSLALVDHGLPETGEKHGLPRSIAEVCKVVHQAKRSLIKVGSPCSW